jgi:hypothetical protein
MIKKLFFTAALLVPGLAYGADPTANLSIQIVPAAAVPAAAQAAGFNNLIINDNFQAPSFASTSTWLDCAGASTPLYWAAWEGFSTPNGPCNAIGQATDPNGGQLALRLHWEDSYINGGNGRPNVTVIETSDSSGNGRLTPPGFYLEVVARTDLATNGAPNPWMDLWSLTSSNTDSYEIDGFEEAGSGGVFALHNNGAGVNSCANINQGCAVVTVNVTQYHTYAWRQTSAGTDIVFCAYIDGNLQGCNSISPTAGQLTSGSGYRMAHQFVNSNSTRTLGNGSTGKNVWIKSVKVWSCAALNSSNPCHSSSNNP